MYYNRSCRGTKTIPFPDYCGLPLYEPWPNSDRFFYNGAYWYPPIENMTDLTTNKKVRSFSWTFYVFILLIIFLILML